MSSQRCQALSKLIFSEENLDKRLFIEICPNLNVGNYNRVDILKRTGKVQKSGYKAKCTK